MNRSKLIISLFILAALSISSYFIHQQGFPGKLNPAISEDDIPIQRSNGETLYLPIEEVPEYDAYLSSQSDRKAEIERTQHEILNESDNSMLIMLKYSCGNKQCATQLVKISGSDILSLPLPVAVFQDYKFSPNNENVLLRYAINEGDVVRNLVVALDVMKMKVLPFQSSTLEDEYGKIPKWPISQYQWMSNNEFSLHIAAADSSSFESLERWFSSGGEMIKTITIKLSES